MNVAFLNHQLLEDDQLGYAAVHGFFGREGGVSKGIYEGLNCGPGSRDDARDVRENRRRAASALGFAADHLSTLYQVHSPNVLIMTKKHENPPQADAMVTKVPDLLLGILTADCAPVLLADAQAQVIGAAHAGWKGAAGGVLENTIGAMESLGASRENIAAVVGPCITQKSYEVGTDFLAHFKKLDEENEQFFVPGKDKYHFQFDLPAYVLHRLQEAGLQRVIGCAMDTASNEKRYYSYRRATLRGEPDYGRQLSAIGLKR